MLTLNNHPNPAAAPSLDQMVELIPDAFVIFDGDHRLLAANAAALRCLSLSREDLRGMGCHEFFQGVPGPCDGEGCCPLVAAGPASQPLSVQIPGGRGRRRLSVRISRTQGDQGGFFGLLLRPEAAAPASPDGTRLVGHSVPMLELMRMVERVAPTSATVLLLGESGVGKERVADYLHHCSGRAQGPLVVVDCSTLGEQIIEAELFGYEKGAFTGADRRKIGLFEAAQGGTLFIDEVGELPLAMQSKLLRVLETSRIRRVGGTDYIPVDARVVAATHRDLTAMVAQGGFREDLYYRLSAFPVFIPPLRERREDVIALAEHFLRQSDGGSLHLPLSVPVADLLVSYRYPGNVRELKNIMTRAAILAGTGPLLPEHIAFQSQVGEEGRMPSLRRGSRGVCSEAGVRAALAATGGHRAEAARHLGVSERTLYRYLEKFQIRV
ncbi:sigma-54 interaction domain-containing protein [Ectothiorhodospira lacustris]|uniref:sigma-54 interaction domain-containing protein n=1 Tax=Ectothiorhodospira lacustris TaxID=2899127 RepID=UPI001EE97839|nr:sigma 54-interacting transcriptional regulator [Ectothiorhodospira lacustris]MCG5508899.1 sigma 54-interacting transcriptional regulator [Ectothiorhodospira lacustris]MCG5520690.1 sigma 54-interacting transcriptional regulator [Ectothiorhodospira lacustris]